MCPMNYTMPPRRRSWMSCLMIPLAIVGAIFLLHRIRSTHYDTPATAILEAPGPEVYEPPQAPDPSVALLADVYPSQESAVMALSNKLSPAIAQIESNPQRIVLSCPENGPERRQVSNLLARDFPSTKISDESDTDDAANAVKVKVQITNEGVFSGKPPRPQRGKVQIDVEGSTEHATFSAKFIDRPWAADPSGYINDNPDRNLIIGRCSTVCMSELEARRIAEEDAIRQAMILIQQHELGRGRRFNGDSAYLVTDVRRSLPIKQRFVQHFHVHSSDVWSEMVLVDAPKGWLESMSQRHAVAMYQHQARVKTTVGSAFIVLITILIAYLFLNAVTKSYFTARLRFVAIMFAVAVMFVAMGIISRA